MKKMPAYKPSIRQVYGEQDWGPTVDGRILPRHPFDPDAPEISADVPLLTGSNLHEFVNGLDRPDANAMRVDELDRLVRQEFGDRGREIVEAYRCNYPEATPFDLYATIAAACVRRPAFEQASRKAALRAAPAYSYILPAPSPRMGGEWRCLLFGTASRERKMILTRRTANAIACWSPAMDSWQP